MYKIILLSANYSESETSRLLPNTHIQSFRRQKNFTTFLVKDKPAEADIQNWRSQLACDVNLMPIDFNSQSIKLVVSDMDSTLINIECIDEIAAYAGVKAQVSEVTEAAMRGELDFAESLLARVKLLAGINIASLQKVYDEKLKLNLGAEQMLASLKKNQIQFALVSGGFTFFTDRLKARLDLDYTLSNTLEVEGSILTGKVIGDIIGGEAKAKFLLEKCRELKLSPSQVVAIGDGANDLLMMGEAGLGVAYHAKPKVQQAADCAINFSGLEGLLSLLELDID